MLSAQSSKRKELENNRKSLLSDIDRTNQLITQNEKTTQAVLNRINLLDQQIDARKKLLELLNQEIAIISEEISGRENQIFFLEKEIREKKKNYTASVRKMYARQNDNNHQFLFIFSADNISQSYQRMLYLRKYSCWQKEEALKIRARQKQVTLEKQALEKNKEEKQELFTVKTEEEKNLNEEENSSKKTVEVLKKNRKQLLADLSKKQLEAKKLSNQIDKIIKEEIAVSQKKSKATQTQGNKGTKTQSGFIMTKEEQKLSTNFVANKGKLPFPLKGHYKVVETFGINRYPDFPGVELYCNGIEIETTQGNDATAVFDGIVMEVLTFPGYDNSILLRHGDYITLYSNLGRIYVKKGDTVKTGQALGKIFTNELKGNSTLLHFEMFKNQTNLNPMLWLNK
jgi:septal ring factor EnvC (AmiA/AmiB activator)